MVSIGYQKDTEWIHECIGSIISKKSIITSAKCVEKKGNKKLRTGDLDLSKPDDDQLAQTYDFEQVNVILHPKWKQNGNEFEHDLALLNLDFEIEFNENTNAICLPGQSDQNESTRDGHYSIATGWGQDINSDLKLAEAAVTIFPKVYCNRIYPEYDLPSTVFCAGHDVSKVK